MKSTISTVKKKNIYTHLRCKGLIIDSNDKLCFIHSAYKIRGFRYFYLPGHQFELAFDE